MEAGVTVLAGTDSLPHARVADEVRAIAAAGVTPHEALASASWKARAYFGFGGLEEGAPAERSSSARTHGWICPYWTGRGR